MLPCKQKFLSGMVFIIYKVTCFEFISVHGLFTSQEKLEGGNKPARRMGDANDSDKYSVQPCRKETSARRVYYVWKNVFSSLLFPRETWIPSKNDSGFKCIDIVEPCEARVKRDISLFNSDFHWTIVRHYIYQTVFR